VVHESWSLSLVAWSFGDPPKNLRSLKLAAWGLKLAAWSFLSLELEAWCLELEAWSLVLVAFFSQLSTLRNI